MKKTFLTLFLVVFNLTFTYGQYQKITSTKHTREDSLQFAKESIEAGLSFYNQGNYKYAYNHFKKAKDFNPKNPIVYKYLGEASFRNKAWHLTFDNHTVYLVANPLDTVSLVQRAHSAVTLFNSNRWNNYYEAALTDYALLIEQMGLTKMRVNRAVLYEIRAAQFQYKDSSESIRLAKLGLEDLVQWEKYNAPNQLSKQTRYGLEILVNQKARD